MVDKTCMSRQTLLLNDITKYIHISVCVGVLCVRTCTNTDPKTHCLIVGIIRARIVILHCVTCVVPVYGQRQQ